MRWQSSLVFPVLAFFVVCAAATSTAGSCGPLIPYLISPTQDANVTQYGFFNFSAGVLCGSGSCGNVTLTLDPARLPNIGAAKAGPLGESGEKIDSDILRAFAEEEEVAVLVALRGRAGGGKGIQSLRSTVRSRQVRVLKRVAGKGSFTLTHRYSTVAMLAGKVTKEGLARLNQDPDVSAVHLDRVLHITLDESVPLINAPSVWNTTHDGANITGAGQTVCVLDTGVDYTHPDLGGCIADDIVLGNCSKVVGGHDFVNDDNNPIDDHSHGTHVAGIVASENDTFRGVAPDAKLVAVKVCSATGSCSSSTMIAGADYCVNVSETYGIKIITMSIGDGGSYNESSCPTWMDEAIDAAYSAGIIFFAASGNELYANGISYPSCSPRIISVASTTKNDQISYFSNTGTALDLLAPGHSIHSTVLNGSFATKSGTSMATPHAAGAAALLLQYRGNVTPDEMMHYLTSTGVNITDPGNGLKFPRLDAYAALEELIADSGKGIIPQTVGARPFYTIDANPVHPENNSCLRNLSAGESCNLTWRVNATGEGNTVWNFFVLANSSCGGGNASSSVNLTIRDHWLPEIIILSPENTTYYTSEVALSYTISENPEWTGCSLDGLANVTLTGNTTLQNLSDGQHSIVVYVNDSSGNLGTSEKTYFTVQAPRISYSPPIINVTVNQGEEAVRNITLSNNGSSNLSVNSSSSGQSPLFYDDVESGEGNWTSEGFWHITAHRSSSETHSWYYGQDSVWNYDNQDGNSGELTSPAIDLTDASAALLTFGYWYETETNQTLYDQRVIQVSVNGSSYSSVDQLYGDAMRVWLNKTLNLSEYVGSEIRIRFLFNTIDKSFNNYEGWYIDDINVTKIASHDWLTTSPETDVIGPGEQKNLSVRVNGSIMYYGNHTSSILLTSNAEENSQVTVPVYVSLMDSLPPTVTIQSPDNYTYNTSVIDLTYTLDEPAAWAGASLDGGENTTLSGNTSISNISSGYHSLTLSARDLGGNTNTSTVYFTVTAPDISVSPLGLSYTLGENGSQTLNLTVGNSGQNSLVFNVTGEGVSGPSNYSVSYPAYVWLEGVDGGTNLHLMDDDSRSRTLPFNFSFYGVNYTTLHVGSNGYVSFAAAATDSSNDAIPSTLTSNHYLIAPLWDDWLPTPPAYDNVYVKEYESPGRFVATWNDITSPGGLPSRSTFQLILYESGDIRFNYQMVRRTHGYTIGLNKGDGVYYNSIASVPGNQSSILFSGFRGAQETSWLTAVPGSGTVGQGSQVVVAVTAAATGVSAGVYNTTLEVESSDLDETPTSIPVTINVTDSVIPQITILSPKNMTYNTSSVELSYTVSENTSWMGVSLNGGGNVTIPGNTTLTNLSNGLHNIIVYAKDAFGNLGQSNTVYFTVQLPNVWTQLADANLTLTEGDNATRTLAVGNDGISTLLYNITYLAPETEILFSDPFPTDSLNTSLWVNTSGTPNITDGGVSEPTPPYSVELSGLDCSITSKTIDLTDYGNVTVSFFYELGGGGDEPEQDDTLYLEIKNSSGWTTLFNISGNRTTQQNYTRVSIQIPANAVSSEFKLMFRSSGSGPGLDSFFVDNVVLSGVNASSPWYVFNESSGNIFANESLNLSITILTENLSAGTYAGGIRIESSDLDETPINRTIQLTVSPSTTTSTTTTSTTSSTSTSTSSTTSTSTSSTTTLPQPTVSYNVSLNASVNESVEVNSSEANVTLKFTANSSITGANLTIERFDGNPRGESSFSVPSLSKYFRVYASENLVSGVEFFYLEFYYAESEVNVSGLDESDLAVYWFDENLSDWVVVNATTMEWVYGTGLNMSDNFLWTNTSHLSDYALAQATLQQQTQITLAANWNLISLPLT